VSAENTPLNLWLWRHGVASASGRRLADPELVAQLDAAPKLHASIKQTNAAFAAALDGLTRAERILAGIKMLGDAAAPGAQAERDCEADVAAKRRAARTPRPW
jgi:hypothetical protein